LALEFFPLRKLRHRANCVLLLDAPAPTQASLRLHALSVQGHLHRIHDGILSPIYLPQLATYGSYFPVGRTIQAKFMWAPQKAEYRNIWVRHSHLATSRLARNECRSPFWKQPCSFFTFWNTDTILKFCDKEKNNLD